MASNKQSGGFTLIELLVIVAVVSLVSVMVVVAVDSSRQKARDAIRKDDLKKLQLALELYYDEYGAYPVSDGDIEAGGVIDGALVSAYLPELPADPGSASYAYQYWRKDDPPSTCSGVTGFTATDYAFYASLEQPSAADIANVAQHGDAFDQCIYNDSGQELNVKTGN